MLLGGDELGRTQRGNNNAYCQDNEVSWVDWDEAARLAALRSVARDDDLAIENDGRRYFAPTDLCAFARVFAQYPDATILAGGTDVGLWVTKAQRTLDPVIYLGRVDLAQG